MQEIISMVAPFAVAVAFPVIRSVAGWAVKALEDKKITKFEWKLLCSTVVRVGLLEAAIFLGLGPVAAAVGIQMDIVAAGAGALLADKLIGAIEG